MILVTTYYRGKPCQSDLRVFPNHHMAAARSYYMKLAKHTALHPKYEFHHSARGYDVSENSPPTLVWSTREDKKKQ